MNLNHLRTWIRAHHHLWFWLTLALLCRLALMPWFLNWDLQANVQVSSHLFDGGWQAVYGDDRSAYPPATYGLLAIWIWFANLISLGAVSAWIGLNGFAASASPDVFLSLLLLKLPFVLAEIAMGALLYAWIPPAKRHLLLWLWWFNPVVWYLVAMFANVDAWPMLAVVLAMYFSKTQRHFGAGVALGIGIGLKIFPLLLAPVVVASALRDGKAKQVITAMFLATLGLQLPAITSPAYLQGVIGGGNMRTILFSSLEIGYERSLLLAIVAWVVGAMAIMHHKFRPELASFLLLLPVFVLSKFHVQWWLWIAPWLTLMAPLDIVKTRHYVAISMVFVALVLTQHPSLSIGMLSPVEPWLWSFPHVVSDLLGKDYLLIQNGLHSVLAGMLVWWAGLSLWRERAKT